LGKSLPEENIGCKNALKSKNGNETDSKWWGWHLFIEMQALLETRTPGKTQKKHTPYLKRLGLGEG